jgi:hypothetical protein
MRIATSARAWGLPTHDFADARPLPLDEIDAPQRHQERREADQGEYAELALHARSGYFLQEHPGFLQAHFAWSVQQAQALSFSQAQAFSLAQLHLSPHTQALPSVQAHALSPLQVQHPAIANASATAAIAVIIFFMYFSFRF